MTVWFRENISSSVTFWNLGDDSVGARVFCKGLKFFIQNVRWDFVFMWSGRFLFALVQNSYQHTLFIQSN